MKKWIPLFLIGLTVFCINLRADDELEDIGSEQIETPFVEAENGPFQMKVMADVVGKAKLQHSYGLHSLYFGTGQAEFGWTYYYDPCLEEGANVTLFAQGTFLDWKSNPYFGQKQITTLGFNLGAFTKRLPDWTWSSELSVNFDNIGHWDFNDYMYYDALLWGRYQYSQDLGLHIGFLVNTGMKINRIYPVIGFDFLYNEKWKFNVVFPMDVSIVYTFNCAWSVAFAGRFFNERHRVKEQEWLSQGLWRYQSAGAEFALNYNPNQWVAANLHVGTTLGGRVTIADRHYRHRQRIRLNPAPYVGGELTVNF